MTRSARRGAGVALEHPERGARRRGCRPEHLEIVWAVRTGTAGTTAEARRQARPTAVHWGIREHARQWVRQAGPQLPTFEIPRAEREIYPDLAHAPDWEQAIAATSFVPDELVARLCDALRPVGAPEYCARRETSPFRTGEPALGAGHGVRLEL